MNKTNTFKCYTSLLHALKFIHLIFVVFNFNFFFSLNIKLFLLVISGNKTNK